MFNAESSELCVSDSVISRELHLSVASAFQPYERDKDSRGGTVQMFFCYMINRTAWRHGTLWVPNGKMRYFKDISKTRGKT